MLCHQLPEPFRTTGELTGPPTTVFHSNTRDAYHCPTHQTPYLLICNFHSCGDYVLNNEPIQANEQLFYFTNPADELEICFEEQKPRETLLVLFDKSMVHQALDFYRRSPVYLLENPSGTSQQVPTIPPIPFSHTEAFRRSLRALCENDGLLRHQVLAQFIHLYGDVCRDMQGIPAQKASTRQELYKRLVLARAFMESNVEEPITIEEIARMAMMNRFHFMATFKSTFGLTPHQYLQQRKLERAYELLGQGRSVTDVCQSVGYQSLGSFTNLFKRTFGFNPSKIERRASGP